MRRCDISFTVYGSSVEDVDSQVGQVLDELLGDTAKDWIVEVHMDAQTVTYKGKASVIALTADVNANRRRDI